MMGGLSRFAPSDENNLQFAQYLPRALAFRPWRMNAKVVVENRDWIGGPAFQV
jgi:hypothetical protein